MTKNRADKNRTFSTVRAAGGPNALLPALVAVGGGLAGSSALAIELGEVKVHSSLGQPLRASIAYALAPNEQLIGSCVALNPRDSADGMPTVNRASIRVDDGVITVSGNTAIREPMLTMRLDVNCPYTPRLSREYLMFFDPRSVAPEAEPASRSAAPARPAATAPAPRTQRPADSTRRPVRAATQPVETGPAPREAGTSRTRASSSGKSAAPVSAAGRYRVQPGDTLSEIAQRIENRPVGLWDAVAAIFEANPDAFINADPNLLKSGSWLHMPDFGVAASTGAVAFAGTQAAEAAASPAQEVENSSAATGATQVSAAESATDISPPAAEIDLPEPTSIEAPAAGSDTAAEIEPPAPVADAVIPVDNGAAAETESDNPFVSPPGEAPVDAIVIPDIELPEPATSSTSPNVATAAIQPPAETSTTRSWMYWLIGGGVGLILALLLFGRGLRGGSREAPLADAMPEPIPVEPEAPEPFVAFDSSPTGESFALDADIEVETGLRDDEIDVAPDFGFAATTELDLELPDESDESAEIEKLKSTDMIEPLHAINETILEDEVLPADEEYDMSVLLDATKVHLSDDITGKDLNAVSVDSGEYTVRQEVDLALLEKDYEDELSATQELNSEITKAAMQLSEDQLPAYDEAEESVSADEMTDELELVSIADLDMTAEMPAQNDDDLEDTLTALLPPDFDAEAKDEVDGTVEMPPREEEATVEMARRDEEATVEMPRRDEEATVEMDILTKKSGTENG